MKAPEDVDLVLRKVLEPGPGAVSRVVAGALGDARLSARRWTARLALAAAVLVALAVPLLWPAHRPPVPASRRITNAGDLVLVSTAEGHTIVTGGDPGTSSAPFSLVIVRSGGLP